MNGVRRPRRSPQGEAGWLRRSFAWIYLRCPALWAGSFTDRRKDSIGGSYILSDINQSIPRHSCESRNPEETWIPPYQVRGRLGQARNDRLHKTYVVKYNQVFRKFLNIIISVLAVHGGDHDYNCLCHLDTEFFW